MDKNKGINEIQSKIRKYKRKIPTGRNLCVRQSSLIYVIVQFPFLSRLLVFSILKSLKGHKMSRTDKIRETSFPDCSTRDMFDYIKPNINKTRSAYTAYLHKQFAR